MNAADQRSKATTQHRIRTAFLNVAQRSDACRCLRRRMQRTPPSRRDLAYSCRRCNMQGSHQCNRNSTRPKCNRRDFPSHKALAEQSSSLATLAVNHWRLRRSSLCPPRPSTTAPWPLVGIDKRYGLQLQLACGTSSQTNTMPHKE